MGAARRRRGRARAWAGAERRDLGRARWRNPPRIGEGPLRAPLARRPFVGSTARLCARHLVQRGHSQREPDAALSTLSQRERASSWPHTRRRLRPRRLRRHRLHRRARRRLGATRREAGAAGRGAGGVGAAHRARSTRLAPSAASRRPAPSSPTRTTRRRSRRWRSSSRVVMNCGGRRDRRYGEPESSLRVAGVGGGRRLRRPPRGEPEFIDRMQIQVRRAGGARRPCSSSTRAPSLGARRRRRLGRRAATACAPARPRTRWRTGHRPTGRRASRARRATPPRSSAATHGGANVGATRRQRKDGSHIEARVPRLDRFSADRRPEAQESTALGARGAAARRVRRFLGRRACSGGANVGSARSTASAGASPPTLGKAGTKRSLLPRLAPLLRDATLSASDGAATGAGRRRASSPRARGGRSIRLPLRAGRRVGRAFEPATRVRRRGDARQVHIPERFFGAGTRTAAPRAALPLGASQLGVGTRALVRTRATALMSRRGGAQRPRRPRRPRRSRRAAFTPGARVGSGGAPAIRRLVERRGAVGLATAVDERRREAMRAVRVVITL